MADQKDVSRGAPKRSKMIDGVFLDQYKYMDESGTVYEWEIENLRFNGLNLTFDFTGTTNFDLNGPPIQQVKVKVYEKKVVARIHQKDPNAAFTLSYSWNIGTTPPDDDALKASCEKDAAAATSEADAFESLRMNKLLDANVEHIDLLELRKACTDAKTQFLDVEFAPNNDHVGPKEVMDANPYGKWVTWRRAPDFMKESPRLFVDGIDPLDIQQGQLGNCWFCSGLACIAEHPFLIEKAFVSAADCKPSDDFDPGAYRVRLCKDGRWAHTTLDDYFPCFPEQGALFSRNHGSELWVLLLEKAFAKIHGSYDDLRSGRTCDALADLTGVPVKYMQFVDDDVQEMLHNGELWKLLLSTAVEDQMVAAGTAGVDYYSQHGVHPENDAGLVSGHAYSVLDCKEGHGHRLLKLRNPWGRFEWKGAWSDSSDLWTDEMKELCKPKFDDSDGIFWMAYEDFIKYFDTLHLGYWHSGKAFRETGKAEPWVERRGNAQLQAIANAKEEWSSATSDAVFKFSVSGDCSAFIGWHQKDRRLKDAPHYVELGVMVLRVQGTTADDATVEIVGDTELSSVDRQSHARVQLSAGEYYLVPYSAGCKMKQHKYPTVDLSVSLHTDDEKTSKLERVEVKSGSLESVLHTRALKQQLLASGNKRDCGDGVSVYSLWSGSTISYAVSYDAGQKDNLEIELDTSGSGNAIGHRGLGDGMRHKAVVNPGDFIVFHRLAALDEFQVYTFKYNMSFRAL